MDLEYKRKNVYEEADDKTLKAIYDYAEEYKKFLAHAKTEREASAQAAKLCEARGYKPFSFGEKLKAGDKRYFVNRDKNIFIIKVGTDNIEQNGVRIMAAHVDSPRLDVKPNPLYEESGMAFLKTHYYGGIKKYQWTALPLALHGVVYTTGGVRKEVCVGEEEGDPIFFITDLLPHLGQEQNAKPLGSAIPAETLNAVVGALPVKKEDDEDSYSVKKGILKLLNKKYGMTEIDFQSSELCFLPAGKPQDVGFDGALISGYGHDDKVCAYPEMTALFESENSPHTLIAVFADKEETGSDGTTGMQSRVINDVIDTIAHSLGANPIAVRYASKCVSADVTAAYDPDYAEVYEKRNSSYLSCGAAIAKYTGARGKSSTNDAPAEVVSFLREALDKAGVIWQMGEMGKTDVGGGGTVAKFIANLGIDTIDIGVPVLAMHAPYELISKADLYSMHQAMVAFCKA
jgi:aspartyl aminopeptidase